MSSIVGEIAIAAAVTKKAMVEIIEEWLDMFSAVIVGFMSDMVWLLPIFVILVVAMINLLRLVL